MFLDSDVKLNLVGDAAMEIFGAIRVKYVLRSEKRERG